ncbi:hypothetical protein [Mailhella sp.]
MSLTAFGLTILACCLASLLAAVIWQFMPFAAAFAWWLYQGGRW